MEVETMEFIHTGKVKVSFEVSQNDWCLVQQSKCWQHIQNFFEVSENKDSQISLIERVNLLETGEI